MKVLIHVKQINEAQETRELFLFSDDFSEMMVNKQIDFKNKKFQVISLEWLNEKRTELKAVCLEIF